MIRLDVCDSTAAAVTASLQHICDQAEPGLIGGCRIIQRGDDRALRASEEGHLANAVARVRCASGAARIVARHLISHLGGGDVDLPRSVGSGPRWPRGYVGSMGHDSAVAVAVAGRDLPVRSVGVDVEPAESLGSEIVDFVATAHERSALEGDLVAARLLFCIKEAVFKATHPVDGVFLDFKDVEYSAASSTARTRTGHLLRIRMARWPRLIALAVLT